MDETERRISAFLMAAGGLGSEFAYARCLLFQSRSRCCPRERGLSRGGDSNRCDEAEPISECWPGVRVRSDCALHHGIQLRPADRDCGQTWLPDCECYAFDPGKPPPISRNPAG